METNKEPGVSGKSQDGKRWVNPEKYQEQKEFMDQVEESEEGFSAQGRGQNLFGRSGLDNQEHQKGSSILEQQLIEALKRSPEVDISEIKINLKGNTAYLEGIAEDANEEREMMNILSNVPGVEEVKSHLSLRSDEKNIKKII